MQQLSTALLFSIIGLSLSSCTALKEIFYDRPNPLAPLSSERLGFTPRDEIIKRFGNPDEINKRVVDSFDAEVYFYYDRDESKGPPVEAKFLACEFNKGVLNAYSFYDSSEPTQKWVDEAERFKLVKGKSTKQEAEQLLGTPTSKALLPTTITLAALAMQQSGATFPLSKIPDDSKEAWQYFSPNYDDYLHKSAQKTLTLFFDAQGIYLGSSMMQELVIKSQ